MSQGDGARHLVCGDRAVASVTRVIGEQAVVAGWRVLRDDLAVGPLHDVDAPPCAGCVALWPDGMTPAPGFAAGLPADVHYCALQARLHP